jgi:hypothetical protein
MPIDDGRKGFLIVAIHKGLQEFSLRRGRFAADDETADLLYEVIALQRMHESNSVERAVSYISAPQPAEGNEFSWI